MNLSLRAIEPKDLPTLLVWRNDPALRRYFREYRPLSYEQQQQWFKDVVLGDPATQMLAIVLDKHLVGAGGLCGIDWVNRSAEISIYLGKGYIDQAVAPEALYALMAYGFCTLGLRRLWAEVYDFDSRKIHLLETMEFSPEAIYSESYWREGRWVNSLIYGKVNDANH